MSEKESYDFNEEDEDALGHISRWSVFKNMTAEERSQRQPIQSTLKRYRNTIEFLESRMQQELQEWRPSIKNAIKATTQEALKSGKLTDKQFEGLAYSLLDFEVYFDRIKKQIPAGGDALYLFEKTIESAFKLGLFISNPTIFGDEYMSVFQEKLRKISLGGKKGAQVGLKKKKQNVEEWQVIALEEAKKMRQKTPEVTLTHICSELADLTIGGVKIRGFDSLKPFLSRCQKDGRLQAKT